MSAPIPPATLPAGKAVDILPSSASQLFSNLHPILLLSVVPIAFGSLVADPVTTLLGLAPTTLALQAIYCVLCLPHTGNTTSPKQKPGPKAKSPKPAQDIWAKLVPALLSLVLTFFLSAPLLYIIALLFGAPLVSHLPHTALLAVHLALLTAPHLFYVHGLDTTAWLRLASLQQPFDEVYGMSLGACAGAWVGAIPIPLDWDREWQKWPVTIICGMYVGAVVGKLAGGYLLKGFKTNMS
ncbi:Putative GPI biosynthesis protein Pig-F [Septoria linicola]|uniref:GPI biosynthesis protein Pig-F n=1 Tax=Septoria linicola TaxID=215465 RepID=A0A9Q9AL42_9PEZI|nr:Putative GPI biosynthesis protein Pig-F [Septoria linicola]